MKTHKTKWLVFAPGGLMVIGLGMCLVEWAADLKRQQVPTLQWFAAGSAALVVLNSGISLFGRGVVEKVLHEVRENGPSAVTVGEIPQAEEV